MDAIFEKYFSIHGRLARLPYFTRGLQLGILASVLFFPSIPLFTSGNDLLWWAGLLLVAVSMIVVAVSGVSLTVRRLHDIGMSGYHAIWIVPTLVVPASGRTPLLVLVPLIAISLWLTFWPGEKIPNRLDA